MHIHHHREWYYVIDWNGEVRHKSRHGWSAAQWAHDHYGVTLGLEESIK